MPVTDRVRAVGNLPADVTALVGRRRELDEARRRLADGRLVTLTGVGGVGKTRLALRLAAKSQRAFHDGVWVADLASLSDPCLLAVQIANALDVRDQSSRPTEDILVEHLADKQVLLVLDNCEHLLSACASLVATLLRAAPNLRVVATSRQLLGLQGEIVLPVPPLEVPPEDVPVNAVSVYSAVALLSDRAAARSPSFAVTERNAASLAKLCRRLDGIPLAIELAAVRLATMSIDEVLDRLDDRFRLLTGGWRAGLSHHQTLRAAVDWSYALCDQDQQLLWARLSVFAGGFDLAAVEAVCSDDELPRERIVDALAALVDKSVVVTPGDDGGMRYRLLETVRQYGGHRLRERAEEATFQQRHQHYFHDLTVRLGAEWFGAHELEWMAIARRELPNLRQALETSFATGATAAVGLDIVMNVTRSRCWFFIGTLNEGRLWLDRALAANPEAKAHRLSAQALAAWVRLVQGDQIAATDMLKECRAAQHVGDAESEALLAYVDGAYALLLQGDQAAISLLRAASSKLRSVGCYGDAHMALVLLSMAATFLGGPGDAAPAAAECLADSRSAGAGWAISWSLLTAGMADLVHGAQSQAVRLVRDSLRRQRGMQDRWGPAWGLEVLAWIAATTDSEHSARLLGAASTLQRLNGVAIAGLAPFAVRHAQCERTVMGSLGHGAYGEVFAEGAALSFDEAIDLALDEKPAKRPEAAILAPARSMLTAREREVAELIAEGLTNRQIAARLVISTRTADTHVQHIFGKLGVTTRAQVASWTMAQQTGGNAEQLAARPPSA